MPLILSCRNTQYSSWRTVLKCLWFWVMGKDSPPAREQFLNAFDTELREKTVLQLENSSWMSLIMSCRNRQSYSWRTVLECLWYWVMGKDSPPLRKSSWMPVIWWKKTVNPPAREQFLNAFDGKRQSSSSRRLPECIWFWVIGIDSSPAREQFLNVLDFER